MAAGALVKVTKLGDRVHEFSLADGETVSDMLAKADLSTASGTVKVNGVPLENFNRPLQNGDLITVTGNVKAGS